MHWRKPGLFDEPAIANAETPTFTNEDEEVNEMLFLAAAEDEAVGRFHVVPSAKYR